MNTQRLLEDKLKEYKPKKGVMTKEVINKKYFLKITGKDRIENLENEMKALQAQNEDLLKEARAERDSIVKDAREIATKMVDDSKNTAKVEAEKIINSAREAVNNEKTAALAEIKTQIAILSIEIAEKVVKGELSSADKQKELSERLAADFNLN